MMTDKEKLAMATSFQVAEDLTIEKRGESTWCVKYFGSTVLDRELERHYEPMPSGRTEEFIAATRFTLDEAFEIASAYVMKLEEEMKQNRI